MPRFRKKPVVVEAEQFFPDKESWPEGVEQYDKSAMESPGGVRSVWHGWRIRTLEGVGEVTPGDWIITGVKGEKYPCKPDIFESTYEPVEDS